MHQPDRSTARHRARATTPAGRHGAPATHHGRNLFHSATQGPMRRDYALRRFLHVTEKYRRA